MPDFREDTPQFPAITTADVSCKVLLLMHTQLCVRLGFDADGSGAVGRYLSILGAFDQLSATGLRQPGMAWDADAGRARALLRARVKAAEPLIARMVVPIPWD